MLIRVDDFPSGSDEGKIVPDVLESFRRFDEVMACPYLLGVVPMLTTPPMWKLVRSLYPRVRVAAHGLSHNRWEISIGNVFMQDLIRIVRKVLGTRVFIPPFNYLDSTILDALRLADYRLVTTGPETTPGLDYSPLRRVDPKWYNMAAKLVGGSPKEFERSEPRDCLTLHWTWERNSGFHHLKNLMDIVRPYALDWKDEYPDAFD